jgi:hypothetical protein
MISRLAGRNGNANGHASPVEAPLEPSATAAVEAPKPPTEGHAPLDTVSDGAAAGGSNGHDSSGRFTKGNKCAAGNPFARRLARLRSLLLDAVSDDDLRAVARKLVEQARDGDTAAAKLLLAYVLGRPAAVVDPDTLDREEWRQCREWPDSLSDPALGLVGFNKVSFAEGVRMVWRLAEMGERRRSELDEGIPMPLTLSDMMKAADQGAPEGQPGAKTEGGGKPCNLG